MDEHYVLDGNHRVAAARQTSMKGAAEDWYHKVTRVLGVTWTQTIITLASKLKPSNVFTSYKVHIDF